MSTKLVLSEIYNFAFFSLPDFIYLAQQKRKENQNENAPG
jgi:hypothetical protein